VKKSYRFLLEFTSGRKASNSTDSIQRKENIALFGKPDKKGESSSVLKEIYPIFIL